MRYAVAGLFVLMLGVSIGVGWERRSTPSDHSGPATPATAEAQREWRRPEVSAVEVAELRQRLEALEKNAREPEPAARDPKAAPTRETLEDRVEAAHENRRAQRAKLDGVIEQPDDDPAWSREQEKALSDAFRGEPTTASLFRNVRCGRGLCRVELDRLPDGEDELDRSFVREHLPRGDVRFDPGLGPNESAVVYIARPGTRLDTL